MTDTLTMLASAAISAAEDYINLQKRITHPNGSFDKAGRWYPSDSEYQECCRQIRTPSRAFPYSLLLHCRSANHVAHRTGVPTVTLLRTAQLIHGTEARLAKSETE